MTPRDEDETDESTTPLDAETLGLVLGAIETANARASESSAGAVAAVQSLMQRVFVIGLVILLLLAAVLGIAVKVDAPGVGEIGLDPDEGK